MIQKHEIQPIICSGCKKTISSAISRHTRKPQLGDVIICEECGCIMIFENKTARKADEAELIGMRRGRFWSEIMEWRQSMLQKFSHT